MASWPDSVGRQKECKVLWSIPSVLSQQDILGFPFTTSGYTVYFVLTDGKSWQLLLFSFKSFDTLFRVRLSDHTSSRTGHKWFRSSEKGGTLVKGSVWKVVGWECTQYSNRRPLLYTRLYYHNEGPTSSHFGPLRDERDGYRIVGSSRTQLTHPDPAVTWALETQWCTWRRRNLSTDVGVTYKLLIFCLKRHKTPTSRKRDEGHWIG